MDFLGQKMQNRLLNGRHTVDRSPHRQISPLNSYSNGKVATVKRLPAETRMRELILPGQHAATPDPEQPREHLFSCSILSF